MTLTTYVLIAGGLAVLLLMALIAVMVARSLDGGGKRRATADVAKFAASLQAETDKVKQALGLPAETRAEVPAHKRVRGAPSAAKAAQDAAEKKDKATKSGWTSVLVSIGVLGGVIGVFVGIIEDDDPVEIVSSEISAGNGLGGLLVSPDDRAPVVLIVPGSGPTDRDGNNPLGVKADAYKMLAADLAQEEIATVRIDKRGMFSSAAAGDPNAVTPDIYARDIGAWIDAIKAERNTDCVFLLGHSEGALMVSLAAQGRRDVCGLILVSGMGRRMGEVLREQLKSNPANAPLLDQAFAALDELEAGRRVDVTNLHPALQQLFYPEVQSYLMSVLGVDPVEALRRAGKDTLILQGDRDLQVSIADARKLDSAPKTRLRIIDGMNHVLKEAPEDAARNMATYADPNLPLANDLVTRIRRFVRDND